ncbi:MAG: hypothetical protein LBD91_03180 [Prevotellaceae bacterium]|jgi:hypothetical protein|nr:hypothetical protein [Prevotellaceae bacterium]
MITVGNNAINAIYRGDAPIAGAYRGGTKIWPCSSGLFTSVSDIMNGEAAGVYYPGLLGWKGMPNPDDPDNPYVIDDTNPLYAKFLNVSDGHVYRVVKMPDGVWWMAESYCGDGDYVVNPEDGQYYYKAFPTPPKDWGVGNSSGDLATIVNTYGGANFVNLRATYDWVDGLGQDIYGFALRRTAVYNYNWSVYKFVGSIDYQYTDAIAVGTDSWFFDKGSSDWKKGIGRMYQSPQVYTFSNYFDPMPYFSKNTNSPGAPVRLFKQQ